MFVRLYACLMFVCLFVRSFVCLFVCLFVGSFVCLLVRSFVCLFVRLFVCLFVCSTFLCLEKMFFVYFYFKNALNPI